MLRRVLTWRGVEETDSKDDFDRADIGIAWRIFLTVCLISAFFADASPPGFYRFERLTIAMIESQSLSVEGQDALYGHEIDTVEINGRKYINHNPGTSFLAIPAYAVFSVLKSNPTLIAFFESYPMTELQLIRVVFVVGAIAPFSALLIALLYLALRRVGVAIRRALGIAFLAYIGTALAYHSRITNNNILEASLTFAAFYLIQVAGPHSKKTGMFALSGFSLGLAFVSNWSTAFSMPAILAYAWFRCGSKSLIYMGLGFLPGLITLMLYQTVAFGNPFLSPSVVTVGPIHLSKLDIVLLIDTLFEQAVGWRLGLLTFCPILLLVLLGLVRRQRLFSKVFNKFVLLQFASYFVLMSLAQAYLRSIEPGINPGEGWHGWLLGGGPRYLLPVIPFVMFLIGQLELRNGLETGFAATVTITSVLLNVPSLMYLGGNASFYNHFLLMLKNGISSSMFREMLLFLETNSEFNLSTFSIAPALILLVVAITLVWGHRVILAFWASATSQ